MTGTVYSPDEPRTAEEIELGEILRRLAYRREEVREDSAEYRMIARQMEGIRHGSEYGGLLMEEYDINGISAASYW